MREAVIVATARTPVGRARKGSLVNVRPDDLLAFAIRAASRFPGCCPPVPLSNPSVTQERQSASPPGRPGTTPGAGAKPFRWLPRRRAKAVWRRRRN